MKKFLNKKIVVESTIMDVLISSGIIAMIAWVAVMLCWCDSDLLKAIVAISEKGVMLNVMFYLLPIFVIVGIAFGLTYVMIKSEKKSSKK